VSSPVCDEPQLGYHPFALQVRVGLSPFAWRD
jgi:hypothetical protein